jgi:hypothetical protein
MPTTISGSTGVTYPAGGLDNIAGAGVGTTDTQTLTNKTLTSPTIGGTPVIGASLITSGTAVATTSGTSVDYTSIPSWVKRITVMLNNVSLSGSANPIIQIGAGSVVTTGYSSVSIYSSGAGGSVISATNGYCINNGSNAAEGQTGIATLCLLNSSTGIWVMSYTGKLTSANNIVASGVLTLSGTLDRIRFTTTNGTDTFDLGSINILYE